MKKLLAILLVVATIFCFAACGSETDNTTTTAKQDSTTTTTAKNDTTTTTVEDGDNTTTTVEDEDNTTTTEATEVVTTTKKPAPTTTAPSPVVGQNGTDINGVDPNNADNHAKVVNSVFTSSNGGIQLKADGWKTYALYSISMVPSSYANVGNTNAICVAVYEKGVSGYDDPAVFENKTEAAFEEVLQADITAFGKTTITSNGQTYTCYKAVVADTYYVWVFQTPSAKYFINFMQVAGMADMEAIGTAMMNSIVIYK